MLPSANKVILEITVWWDMVKLDFAGHVPLLAKHAFQHHQIAAVVNITSTCSFKHSPNLTNASHNAHPPTIMQINKQIYVWLAQIEIVKNVPLNYWHQH